MSRLGRVVAGRLSQTVLHDLQDYSLNRIAHLRRESQASFSVNCCRRGGLSHHWPAVYPRGAIAFFKFSVASPLDSERRGRRDSKHACRSPRRSTGGDRTAQKVGEGQYSFAGFTGAAVCSQHVQRPALSDERPRQKFHRKTSFVSVHENARRRFFPSPESRNSTLIPSLRASSAHAAQTFISMI